MNLLQRIRLTTIAIASLVGMLVLIAVVATSTYLVYSKSGEIADEWKAFESVPAQKSALLNDLRSAIGFGGAIHHFKNYVLRLERPLIVKVHTKLREAKVAIADYRSLPLVEQEKNALDTIERTLQDYASALAEAERLALEGAPVSIIDENVKIPDEPALQAMKALDETLFEARAQSTRQVNEVIGEMLTEVVLSGAVLVFICVVFGAMLMLVMRAILAQLGAEPGRLRHVADAIADGDLEVSIHDEGRTSRGVFAAMERMRDKLREQLETNRRNAEESGRIKQALDNVSAPVVVAAADARVIYANDAACELFAKAETEIRKHHPAFAAAELLGSRYDALMESASTDGRAHDLQIGNHSFVVVRNRVKDESGNEIGAVVEWVDRTSEVQVENAVSELVRSARAGDLARRMDLSDKEGFHHKLCVGLNELLDVIDKLVSEQGEVMGALADGDLSHSMGDQYEGAFARLAGDTNQTIVRLKDVISDVQRATGEVEHGVRELADGNTALSERTESQASSLQETAATMEQITKTVSGNADSANRANEFAASARDQAQQGGEVVNRAVQAMQAIENASKQINDIIGVIDDIAF
ncbi:MAG: PAS domain-containing protein, partial [Gammaproteobacteria bacterium]|nr:PAS domain-containing protein [Gammaproteobacteria bacterium]